MVEPGCIGPARTIADFQACQGVQRRAWELVEESYVVPVATLVGASRHGGLVLLARTAGGEAVGMSFGFLGRVEGRLVLYSQLTGVVAGYRGQGIGEALKRFQWRYARDEGLHAVAWTFDPLQAGNAAFNLGRLGAWCGAYFENLYGPRTDPLNRGVPTDRLEAVWETGQARERRPASEWLQAPRLVGSCLRDGRREPLVDEGVLSQGFTSLLLEIPGEIGSLRATDPELAERWRQAVGRAFRGAFAAGYRAVDFVRDALREPAACYDVLSREESERLTVSR